MRFDPDKQRRKSIRLNNYDYSLNGAYFVTLCTYQRESLLGEIKDRKMCLNPIGQVVQGELFKAIDKREHIQLGIYVIMPDHIHFIVIIESDVGARLRLAQNKIQNQRNTGRGTASPLQLVL